MPTRNARPTTFRWKTLTDAVDSTNGPQGGAQLLQNLVPAPYNREFFVPRAAALQLTNFPFFTSPATVELQYVAGNRVYGYVASGRFPGRSEPFIYDYIQKAFIPLNGVNGANCPYTAATTGDWIPPTAAQVGGRVMTTHPGFTGAASQVMGWFDMTGLASVGITGNTNSTTTVSGFSFNVLQAGWAVGMRISDSANDIATGTTIQAIAANGLSLTLSSAASGSNTGTTFVVQGGTFAQPLYCAGNMNQNPLPAVPVAVANFNGRAYYAVAATLQFSDAGNAVQDSNNPNVQVINFQNGIAVTALAGTPFNNVLGGITQALLAFQGASNIQQITGDPTTSNLAAQLLAGGTGTLAPNTLSFVPNNGMAFVSPDGLRFVSLTGIVTPALGTQGDGISLAFINALYPSRMAAAWNDDTLRIAVPTAPTPGMIWGQATWGKATWGSGSVGSQEYWFHTKLNVWSGTHSFQTSLISAANATGGFIISSAAVGAALWSSNAVPTAQDGYFENGLALQCNAVTALLPDNQLMAMNSLNGQSCAIGFASSIGMTVTVEFMRENGQVLDNVLVPVSGGTAAVWGYFVWGRANWGTQSAAAVWDGFNWAGANWGEQTASGSGQLTASYSQYAIYWNQPLVFKQGSLGVSFQAGPGALMGNVYLRIEPLSYLLLGYNDAA